MPTWKVQKEQEKTKLTVPAGATCKDCDYFEKMGKSSQGYCRKLTSKKSITSKACKSFKKRS